MIGCIDIGTSYTKMSVINGNNIDIVKIATGSKIYGDAEIIPSSVFLMDNNELAIGQFAEEYSYIDFSKFKDNFKKDFGSESPYNIGEFLIFPQDIYMEIIRNLVSKAEESFNQKIKKLYISYPSYYSTKLKEELINTAKRIGINDIELITDPVASISYFYNLKIISSGNIICVIDLGQSKYEISLVEITDDGFIFLEDPIAVKVSNGNEIDQLIFKDILKKIPINIFEMLKYNKKIQDLIELNIKKIAKRAKHYLSSNDLYEENFLIGFNIVKYSLSKIELSNLIKENVINCIKEVNKLIDGSNARIDDIDFFILTGGNSNINAFEDEFKKEFNKSNVIQYHIESMTASGIAVYSLMIKNGIIKNIVTNNRVKSIGVIKKKSKIINVGDFVQFGFYNNEKILWKCVEKNFNSPLLISEYVLCLRSFDTHEIGSLSKMVIKDIEKLKYNKWGHSNIRKWINSDEMSNNFSKTLNENTSTIVFTEQGFLAEFTDEELNLIKESTRDGVSDRAFIMSEDEIKKVFITENDRIKFISKSAEISEKISGAQWYWTRSSHGLFGNKIGNITFVGKIDYCEKSAFGGVVPALYISDDKYLAGEGTKTNPYIITKEILENDIDI